MANDVVGLNGVSTNQLSWSNGGVSSSMAPRGVFENVLGFLGRAIGMAGGSVPTGALNVDSQYTDLIGTQMEVQRQMMIVNLVSNVIKSEHETKMGAVRNIRVG